MAVVDKRLARANFSQRVTLYTCPANTKTFVKAVSVCNPGSSPAAFTLVIGGIAIIASYSINPRDTITIPFLDHVIEAGDTIQAEASSSSNIYISGREVS